MPTSYDAGDIASIASKGAALTGSILAAFAGPGSAMMMAGPIGAAVAGLTAIGLVIASMFQGCGQSCTLTSDAANQVEVNLVANLNHYRNAPIHYKSLQMAALNNFDTAWAALVKYCSQSQFTSAGVNCVQDRQAGACKWKNDGNGGPAGSGNVCWNWFVGYRDPIANDASVVNDPSPLSVGVSGVSSTPGSAPLLGISGSDSSVMYIIGAIALAIIIRKARQ